MFYNQLDEDEIYYLRGHGLENTYRRHLKNTGNGVQVGGIQLTTDQMREDYTSIQNTDVKTAGWAMKDLVFDITVMQGRHGAVEYLNVGPNFVLRDYIMTPSPQERLIKFRDNIVEEFNRTGDSHKIFANAIAMEKGHYRTFRKGGR